MAEEISTSALFRKYQSRFKTASRAHASDEYVSNVQGRIPAGIENGIARLNLIKLGEFETGPYQGQPYANASGTCVFPEVHDGVPTAGLPIYTNNFALCATGQGENASTEEDNFGVFQNFLKGLLGPGDHTEAVLGENLMTTIQALNEAKPTFRFRTWVRQKQVSYQRDDGQWIAAFEDGTAVRNKPGTFATKEALKAKYQYLDRDERVNADWGGYVELPGGTPAAGGGVDDGGTPEPAPAKTAPKAAAAAPAKPAASAKPGAKPAPKPAPEPEPEPADVAEMSFEELGVCADAGLDGADEAMVRLEELAAEHGVEKDDEGNWPGADWKELAAVIAEAAEGGGGEEPEAEAGDEYEVGQTFKVELVLDPKKPKVKKAVDCEIEAVYPDEREVEVKNLTTGKAVMDPASPLNPKTKLPSRKLRVSFDDLIPIE